MSAAELGGSTALGLLIIAVLVLAYVAPSVIAVLAKSHLMGVTIVVNLLLGWTGLGWVVALVMALWPEPQRPQFPYLPPPYPHQQWQPPAPPAPPVPWEQRTTDRFSGESEEW